MTTNGKAPPDPLDELEEAIAELEGEEWEEITETQVIAQPGSTVIVDQTGKHQALRADDLPTRPDMIRPPKPDSTAPKARFALAVLDRIQPPWLRVPVVLAVIGAVVFLVERGVRLWP